MLLPPRLEKGGRGGAGELFFEQTEWSIKRREPGGARLALSPSSALSWVWGLARDQPL